VNSATKLAIARRRIFFITERKVIQTQSQVNSETNAFIADELHGSVNERLAWFKPLDLPVGSRFNGYTMRRLLIIIFSFVLITGPFMAHHANGETMHIHGNPASHGQQAVGSSQCELGCDVGLQTTCCSQAITHCSPTSSYNEVWTDVPPAFATDTYFVERQDLLVSLTFEAETPPPRV